MMKDEATSNDNKEMSEGISRSVPEVPSIFMNPGQSHKESRKGTKPESQVTEVELLTDEHTKQTT